MKNFCFIFLFLFILISQSLFAENENLLNIKGLIEIDYYLAKVNDGTTNRKESDFLLSTAQLSLEKELNKKIKSSLVFLYEQGEDNDQIKIDEAKLDIVLNEKTNFIVGKRVLPFGVFETFLISDPLTLNIGETKKVSAGLSYKIAEGLNGEIALFKGPKESAEENNVAKDLVLNLNYEAEYLKINLGYITSMLAIDKLPDELGIDVNNDTIDKRGNGLVASLNVTIDKLILIGEGITNKGEIKVNNTDYNIKAYNVEAGYQVNEKLTAGIRYEFLKYETNNNLTRKVRNYGIGLNRNIYENTNLLFEYLKSRDNTTGANELKNDIFTVEISYQF